MAAHRIALVALGLTLGCRPATTPPSSAPGTEAAAATPEQPAGSAREPEPEPQASEDLAATVNGKPIPLEAFTEIFALKVAKYSDRGREIPPSAERRYRKSISERLVYQEVLRQEAATRGVDYDRAALAQREADQKRGIRDWDKHLQRRGETAASLRNMYIAELLELALLETAGSLTATDREVDEEYLKVRDNYRSDKPRARASHILIPIGPVPVRRQPLSSTSDAERKKWESEARAEAKDIHRQATAPNADFAALAREHSSGPSAQKGGDIGIFTADRMVEEFSKAVFSLKVGRVSKPVKSKFGYHIIKVTGRWGPGHLPKSALEDQIRDRLRQRKIHQGRRALKERLLDQYRVEILVPQGPGAEEEQAEKKPRVGPI